MKYAESRTARQHLIQEVLANKTIASQNELLIELKKKDSKLPKQLFLEI